MFQLGIESDFFNFSTEGFFIFQRTKKNNIFKKLYLYLNALIITSTHAPTELCMKFLLN